MENRHIVLSNQLNDDLSNYAETEENNPWSSVQTVAADLLRRKAFTKFEGSRGEKQRSVAIDKFLFVNRACKNYRLEVTSSLDELLLGNLRWVMDKFFYPYGHSLWETDIDSFGLGVGPGASHGAVGQDVYHKLFDGPLAASSKLAAHAYLRYCSLNPTWCDAEKNRALQHGGVELIGCTRLSTVGKNEDTDRVIMISPAINMAFQLSLGRIIEARLDSFFGISISGLQSSVQHMRNQSLAVKGSVDDSNVTIDLRSASDYVGIKMLKEVIPKQILTLLLKVRDRRVDIDGEKITLNMIGTMGNGFTFPLQTSLFAGIVYAAYLTAGVPFPMANTEKSDWGVFGDDIICPRGPVHRFVMRLLALLGFEINVDKSFVEGPFRESCGIDAFKGVNVRPVYIKRLGTKQDLFVAINRLTQWSVRHNVPLPKTMHTLLKWVGRVNWVPPWESMDAGVHVPIEPEKVRRDSNHSYLYYAWAPHPRTFTVKLKDILSDSGWRAVGWDAKTRSPYNGSGLYLSFLFGSIRTHRIGNDSVTYAATLRNEGHRKRYRLRLRVAPNWGHVDPEVDVLNPLERRRWNALAPLYIGTNFACI